MITIRPKRLMEIILEILLVVAVGYLGWQYKINKLVLADKKLVELKLQEQSRAVDNFLLDLKGIEDLNELDRVLRKYKIR